MRRLYSALMYCLAPLAFSFVLWRGLREREYWAGLGERFGLGADIADVTNASRERSIWVHAVSLGEMSAAAPLIKGLLKQYPHSPLVITTATPAGRARATALFADVACIRFLPYDTPGAVHRFLERIRPRVAIIMETELWPNLWRACARAAVPVVLASARLTARSVPRYRRMGRLITDLFTENVWIAAQSTDDAGRFEQIGAAAERMQVVGNVKFDVDIDANLIEEGRRLREAFGSARSIWVAGSTHAGEDEAALRAHAQLLRVKPRALLLLAPRHRDRFETVAALLEASGLKFERRSTGTADKVPHTQVLLVDTLGELTAMYAAADLAFVGGSLVRIGGHNLLEPAALGLPVLSGPHQDNNKEIAALLTARGAVRQVANTDELGDYVSRLFGDPEERRRMGEAGVRVVAANRGCVSELLQIIEPLLAEGPGARPAAVN